jgi:hypothetical protein
MNWVFDLDTRKLSEATTGMAVVKVPLSYPDKYPVSVSLVKSGIPFVLTGSVFLVVKAASRPLSEQLALLEVLFSGGAFSSGVLNTATAEMDLCLSLSGSTQLTLDVSVISSGQEVSSLSVPAPATRRYYTSGSPGPTSSIRTLASEQEARDGVDNTKWMSPLRTAQAVTSTLELAGIELI